MSIANAMSGLTQLVTLNAPSVSEAFNGDRDNLPITHDVKAVIALDEEFIEYQPEDGDQHAVEVRLVLMLLVLADASPAEAEAKIAQAQMELAAIWWTPVGVSLNGAEGVRRARWETGSKGYASLNKHRVLVSETIITVVIEV